LGFEVRVSKEVKMLMVACSSWIFASCRKFEEEEAERSWGFIFGIYLCVHCVEAGLVEE
jgi:hypothetical protein